MRKSSPTLAAAVKNSIKKRKATLGNSDTKVVLIRKTQTTKAKRNKEDFSKIFKSFVEAKGTDPEQGYKSKSR